ncbi:MAG: Putative oxidoreductase [uncultured Solirubrobacteraceae bacterium]|uniref:Oxidoreductase n=1 Tax=uncultured Solirubrobacteraceae bacterium TaxID=1162706 RepID=A0A6J4SMV8_9ACTN|nr:MAG: Putative oxidoreductase [uncultured Solirubrobacteraceae bacterium]
MHYTTFGRSGLRVSELALGTMTFGGDEGVSLDDGRAILDAYAEAGGNFVDTADRYRGGASERMVGELLGSDRDHFVLGTKYTLESRAGDVNAAGNHRKNLVQALDASLKRLQTDYVDVYWVHARDTLTPVEEVMRALDDQVRAGKILYAGVSDWPAWEVAQANTLAAERGWTPFCGLQIEVSLIERTTERELQPMARALDLAVCAWSPLFGGLLTGKYLADSSHEEAGRGRRADRGVDARAEAIVRETVAVADELDVLPSQVALAWLRGRPGTVIPIVGATSLRHLEQNLGCLDVSLSAEQTARLDAVSAVDLGFPYAFLQGDTVRNLVYGSRRGQIRERDRLMADG